MTILVMADLEMLVLSKANFDAYHDEFFDRFLTLAEDYHGWVQQYDEAKWIFSDDLLEELQAAFPWNATSPRLTDLIAPSFEFIQYFLALMQVTWSALTIILSLSYSPTFTLAMWSRITLTCF